MNKIQLDLKKVEARLGKCLKRNVVALGLDTASKTGYCIAKTDDKKLVLNIGFIDVDVSSVKDRVERNMIRYNAIFDTLQGLMKTEYITVIEDVYNGGNSLTLILLARIGAIAYCIAKTKNVQEIIWKSASQARSSLNINQRCPKGKSKIFITKRLNTLLKTNITDNDEIDAIVLAINGLLK